MLDIGAQLRETRMRRRIDISEVEAATKIRAKYLRALENEEWSLLPGPTFVKTFLRTYAEYLELDSKLLVEEYKQRFERPGPQDLLPFGPRPGRRQRRAPVIPPLGVVGAVVVILLVVLFVIGKSLEGDNGGGGGEAAVTPTPTATATATPKRTHRKRPAAPTRVRLQIVPTGTVNVCLVDGAGKVLIKSQNLVAGAATRVFRAKRL